MHSLFGPSSLSRRFYCPGSWRMEKDLPETTNPDAEQGKQLHYEIAEMIVRSIASEEKTSSNPAVNFCFQQFKQETIFQHNYFIEVEKTFKYTDTTIPEVEIGTADLVLYEPYNKAHIFDWKFGHNHVEEADNNLQLGVYAIAAFKEWDCETVTVHVVEAVHEKVTEYKYVKEDIERIEKYVKMIIQNCKKAFAFLRPSKSNCQYCRALTTCPAVTSELVEGKQNISFSELPIEEISKLLNIADINDLWSGKVKEYGYSLAMSGTPIPNWKLKPGRKIRSWIDNISESVLINLAKQYSLPVEGISKKEILSPAQLEAYWGGSKIIKEEINALTQSKQCKPSLVKE